MSDHLPGELRYYGPDKHADWCPGDPSHQGACLDQMLAKVDERAEQYDDPECSGRGHCPSCSDEATS